MATPILRLKGKLDREATAAYHFVLVASGTKENNIPVYANIASRHSHHMHMHIRRKLRTTRRASIRTELKSMQIRQMDGLTHSAA